MKSQFVLAQVFNSLQRRFSRKVLAALWFAVFGFLSVALLFFRLRFAFGGLLLYILLPTVASALAGFFWGGAILDSSKTGGYARCLLRGVGVTAGAFAIFAALFAVALPLTERGWALSQVGKIFLTTLIFGAIATGPVVVAAGMLGAATLYALGRRGSGDHDGRGS